MAGNKDGHFEEFQVVKGYGITYPSEPDLVSEISELMGTALGVKDTVVQSQDPNPPSPKAQDHKRFKDIAGFKDFENWTGDLVIQGLEEDDSMAMFDVCGDSKTRIRA